MDADAEPTWMCLRRVRKGIPRRSRRMAVTLLVEIVFQPSKKSHCSPLGLALANGSDRGNVVQSLPDTRLVKNIPPPGSSTGRGPVDCEAW